VLRELGGLNEQIAEALRHEDHGRHGALERGEARGDELAEVVARGGVGSAAEIALEGSVEEEKLAQARGMVKTSWR
jgi:hypothetical protein